jgi:hypothetical protein
MTSFNINVGEYPHATLGELRAIDRMLHSRTSSIEYAIIKREDVQIIHQYILRLETLLPSSDD